MLEKKTWIRSDKRSEKIIMILILFFRRQGVLDACTFWFTKCRIRTLGRKTSNSSQVWNSIFYNEWYSGMSLYCFLAKEVSRFGCLTLTDFWKIWNHCTLHSRVIKSRNIFLSFWLESGLLIIKTCCNQIEVVILAPKAVLQLFEQTWFSPWKS